MNKVDNFYIFAFAAHGEGISGGDRIFIEFSRRWSKNFPVTIYLWEEGYNMCLRQKLQTSNIKFKISKMEFWKKFGFLINYIARIIEGIRLGFSIKLKDDPKTVIYTASEFWMDCLPGFLLKLRYPNIKWVAAWYQTAPVPWKGYNEGVREKKHYLRALIYWLVQLPVKPLIENRSDLILINNEQERQIFSGLDKKGKVMVVLGAVNIREIESWKRKLGNQTKIYDAVFQGRFHPQKGVVELIDIWKFVVAKKPGAKLIMIGDGPLMKDVKLKIKNLKLADNIILRGFLFDGEDKYKIFSQSKIVAHPAFYDSGGMASAEAMAFGLPAVGFDLKSFKSYYPQGMVKVRIGDLKLFAKGILDLLYDQNKREEIGKKAINMINISWSWDKKAEDVLKNV